MAGMTFIWTTLPAGVRRSDSTAQWKVRISLLLSPRLDAADGPTTLADYPAFVDWPRTLEELAANGMEFELRVRRDDEAVATTTLVNSVDSDQVPDSLAWRQLFDEYTNVENAGPPIEDNNDNLLNAPATASIEFYDGGDLTREIRQYYRDTLRHDLGLSNDAPSIDHFAIPDILLRSAPAVNDSAIERFARFYFVDDDQMLAGSGNDASEIQTPGFHQMISALGSHPHLLRKLGLLLDFELTLEELPLPILGTDVAIRIVPTNAELDNSLHHAHWTAVDYRAGSSELFRLFTVAQPTKDTAPGFSHLALDTTIAQENVEHAALTLMQQAKAQNEADRQQIPALLQGGMRIMQSGQPEMIQRSMEEQSRLEQSLQLKKSQLANNRPSTDNIEDDETLYADQLTMGFRADVRSIESGRWRSLCRRSIRYRVGAEWSWPAVSTALDDEGLIEPSVYSDRHATQETLRTTTDLFEWNGWSLVVPRPDGDNSNMTLIPAELLPEKTSPLTAKLKVPQGSLESLRFGQCYTFRTRNVYLAGVGLSPEEADAIQDDLDDSRITTAPTCCLRVESVKPPVTVRAQERGFGEAGDLVVLRDADDSRFSTPEYKLHLLPPEASLGIVEMHGFFDTMSAADSWRLIESHRGRLARDADASDSNDTDGQNITTLNREQASSETVTARELFTPYLPDPFAMHAVLSLPDDAGTVDLPPFDDLPRNVQGKELARSCRLVFSKGQNGINVHSKGRDTIVELMRGRIYTLKLATRLSTDQLSVMAVAHKDWHGDDKPGMANNNELASAASTGNARVVAPTREIKVVYATQRPLTAPAFGRALILPRLPEGTSARLADDSLTFDRQSTGRIDVYARWQDPVDDPEAIGWASVSNEMHAGGVEIDLIEGKPLDPVELEQVSRSPLSHDFGDTRHHEVSYTSIATSRFADFYPAEVTGDPQNITQVSASIILHVPATAPPASSEVAYVLPTFRRHKDEIAQHPNGELTLQQRGEGLRVYLQRGWFSSGQGEQLALLVATPNTAQEVREKVSQWGTNPVRDAAPLPGPLEMEHVWGGAERLEQWSMANSTVGLVIYDVHWSEEHQLPFVDIEFMSQRAFMPFVRLALARYQKHAIENCQLSDVTLANFVPLSPGRTVTVNKLNRSTWDLQMRGYSYTNPGERLDIDNPDVKTSVVDAHIEVMPRNTPEDVAAWRPLDITTRLQPDTVEPWRFHWKGQLRIDNVEYLSRRWRRRIVIREYEVFSSDGDKSLPLSDRSRLVSAHSVGI